jgi:leucyl/phenylalanyl-tRNA---protein transferase
VTVYRLDRRRVDFPPAEEADPDGLVAVGGDLRPERLLRAYASGIFPWFTHRRTPYWFSPDPRCVLDPATWRPPRSLARTLRAGTFEISYDSAFDEVVRACAEAKRPHESGTWITADFVASYVALHRLGFAHSVEARRGGALVGGLYGVSIGGAFFGESMFHRETDASKAAFATLVARLAAESFTLLDCQAATPHLLRLGAAEIPRAAYLRRLADAVASPTRRGSWAR